MPRQSVAIYFGTACLTAICLVAPVAASIWQPIERTPGFPQWRKLLTDEVNREGHFYVNHLCVIANESQGRAGAKPTTTAYAYWPEEQRIEVIGPTNDSALTQENLGLGPIDLNRDLIGEHGQTGLSPTSVTRAWVDRLVRRCRAQGTRLTVVRGTGR